MANAGELVFKGVVFATIAIYFTWRFLLNKLKSLMEEALPSKKEDCILNDTAKFNSQYEIFKQEIETVISTALMALPVKSFLFKKIEIVLLNDKDKLKIRIKFLTNTTNYYITLCNKFYINLEHNISGASTKILNMQINHDLSHPLSEFHEISLTDPIHPHTLSEIKEYCSSINYILKEITDSELWSVESFRNKIDYITHKTLMHGAADIPIKGLLTDLYNNMEDNR